MQEDVFDTARCWYTNDDLVKKFVRIVQQTSYWDNFIKPDNGDAIIDEALEMREALTGGMSFDAFIRMSFKHFHFVKRDFCASTFSVLRDDEDVQSVTKNWNLELDHCISLMLIFVSLWALEKGSEPVLRRELWISS